MQTRILAIDLGTTTGWATGNLADIVSGTQSFKPGRFEGGGMRFLRFRNWLSEMRRLIDFNQVYFEEVRRHVGTDAAHVYGGLMGTLTAFCEEHKIPYSGVPVGTIKKHATGKGNASKSEMISAAAHAHGEVPKDDNEADAICLLCYALDQHGLLVAQQ